MLTLDKMSRTPIYEQIINNICREISAGVLAEETQLPSVRELSATLGINPNTVQRAYNELDRRGYIVTVAARGAFVARNAREKILHGYCARLLELSALAKELREAGVPQADIVAAVTDITTGGPDNDTN